MLNRIALIGRLGRDPELKVTPTGKSVAEFSIGVNRQFDKNATDWFRVKCWGKTAEFVGEYLTKGRLVVVDGRMESRKYTDKDGNNREVWEVTADNVSGLDKPSESTGQSQSSDHDPVDDEYNPFADE